MNILHPTLTMQKCSQAADFLRVSAIAARFKCTLAALVCLALLTVVGCSESSPGGGGIGGTGQPQPSSIEGIIIGRVDGFGSIIINDRRFETDDAEILVDRNPAVLADIQIGMKVSARVNYDNMTASSVYYQPAVVGKVEGFVASELTMNVLGQDIQLMENTVLDGFNKVSLVDGTAIEVSGDRDSNNVIIAEYVKLVEQTDEFYSIGEVDEEETGVENLALISGMLVNFSQLAEELGLSASDFAEKYLTPGTLLRSGASNESPLPSDCRATDGADGADANLSTNTLNEVNIDITGADGIDGESCIIAGSVNVIDKVAFTSDDQVEMVGIVSRARDQSSFVTNNIVVFTTDDTLIFNRFGVLIPNVAIQQNESISINGSANRTGGVVADSIVLLDRQ